ncbi:MAG TPA: hypothetical protein DCY79_02465 [Planctomycetaceae bacterium]|nr:hypothetical protein [Blastopirellula sp.]HAY78653.1 hypothetical protein [Planctomycetaceae bacterium]
MHGSICTIAKKFVEHHHGSDVWNVLLERAACPGVVFSPIGDYPDEQVVGILTAACELLECELRDLLIQLGNFAGPELVTLANNMLHPSWRTFELVSNLETLIHRTIKINNPTAQPANIQAHLLTDNEIQVVYTSRRGLCALAQGILEGVIDHYGEEIEVEEVTCTQNGAPFCTFSLTRQQVIEPVEVRDIGQAEDTGSAPESTPTVIFDVARPDGQSAGALASGSKNITASSDTDWYLPQSNVDISGAEGGEYLSTKIPFPKRIGRYMVEKVLGVGGMGVVFRAVDESLDRLVAIKTLRLLDIDKESSEIFVREARTMARLNHENVVRIYDVGEFQNRPYFVMEYIEGQTLQERLAKGTLGLKLGCQLFLKILDGLNAVHKAGMVHRDIKPANIILSRDARKCQLLDFGLADSMIGGSKATFGATSGTRGYIAPERIKGYPADFRSDIFSLGCVAYEIFCGETAFGTHCAKSVLNAMKGFQPNSLTWNDIPSSLRDMITGMLKVNREKRLTDIEQVRALIVKILEAQQTRTDGAS